MGWATIPPRASSTASRASNARPPAGQPESSSARKDGARKRHLRRLLPDPTRRGIADVAQDLSALHIGQKAGLDPLVTRRVIHPRIGELHERQVRAHIAALTELLELPDLAEQLVDQRVGLVLGRGAFLELRREEHATLLDHRPELGEAPRSDRSLRGEIDLCILDHEREATKAERHAGQMEVGDLRGANAQRGDAILVDRAEARHREVVQHAAGHLEPLELGLGLLGLSLLVGRLPLLCPGGRLGGGGLRVVLGQLLDEIARHLGDDEYRVLAGVRHEQRQRVLARALPARTRAAQHRHRSSQISRHLVGQRAAPSARAEDQGGVVCAKLHGDGAIQEEEHAGGEDVGARGQRLDRCLIHGALIVHDPSASCTPGDRSRARSRCVEGGYRFCEKRNTTALSTGAEERRKQRRALERPPRMVERLHVARPEHAPLSCSRGVCGPRRGVRRVARVRG